MNLLYYFYAAYVVEVDVGDSATNNASRAISHQLTNYRLSFVANGGARLSFYSVPLTTIQSVELKRPFGTEQIVQQAGLFLLCKDMRQIRFVLPDVRARDELGKYICDIIHPTHRTRPLFAYLFGEACIAESLYLKAGWNVYNPEDEYHRQNVLNNGWRISKVNEGYKLCRTYPEVLVVPAKVTDDLLIRCAPHRARGRLPVLSWLHPESRASLTRAAQPLAGVQGRRNEADEELVRCIREANANTVNLLVFDARHQFTAVVNRGRGGGMENPAFYTNIQYSFMNIPNLHAMRASFAKLMTAINSVTLTQQDNVCWLKTIHNTKWLHNTQQILSAAAAAADQIENHKSSILVHCSDGWDRTPQVTSLAMLMLDPYYRTLRGFQTLVEKEWISFGHKFCQRTGGPADGGNLIFPHTSPALIAGSTSIKVGTSNPEERSPIFLQFIDCVWQMMIQFPASFEFNEPFLVTILDELYASRFGTFLFDSECEARNNFARTKTVSLWGYINSSIKAYLNPTYTPAEVSGHRLIIPCSMSYQLELWKGYYLRWQPFMRCQEPVLSRSSKVLDRMQKFRALSRRSKRGGTQKANVSPVAGSITSLPLAEMSTLDASVTLPAAQSAVSPRRIFPRFPISTSNIAAVTVAPAVEKAPVVAAQP
ncbi:Myotubularin-related protein 2 [Echinococcus granulosus]|uniref:Myotubularin protein 2 n=1 Tax=Echinococcus granulosus TaxID=6210 RepID=A0A068WBI3_ECHGR|nr:Myotubularin-related protein 2 [Echinococcus granulosus]CDS17445.1 Myotubularin protein 2 [Echinococcus granulosus]